MDREYVSTVKQIESVGVFHYTKRNLFILCDRDISRYYRTLLWFASNKTIVWHKPMMGAHITVIFGKKETPANMDLWGKYDGQQVEFSYVPFAPVKEFGNRVIWFPVSCPKALHIREELGLTKFPKIPLHLTIGNTKYEDYKSV